MASTCEDNQTQTSCVHSVAGFDELAVVCIARDMPDSGVQAWVGVACCGVHYERPRRSVGLRVSALRGVS
ncbi:hypothetical protein KIN20_019735 [Parelaphostrongylus tenuis]|uniref:Uncharacterized protein n=1 Tax=Parelaphostrongylus tenuis TaxID=148309 RepID=A0AAD5QT67_PARTN|nr:hypothetical protein KIN20_019735 [Parelaphostrongylus tenuis]